MDHERWQWFVCFVAFSFCLCLPGSVSVSVSLSTCLSLSLSLFVSVCISACLPACLSVSVFLSLSLFLSVFLPVRLSPFFSVLSVFLSISRVTDQNGVFRKFDIFTFLHENVQQSVHIDVMTLILLSDH